MIIEPSTVSTTPNRPLQGQALQGWPRFVGVIFGLAAISLPVLIIGAANPKPTGTILSPLPAGEIATAPTSQPTPLSFSESLNLAQNYLAKAYDLARNQNQNETDKKAILASLNQSLRQVDYGIKLDSQNPQGYLLRAQILTAISKINPKALEFAKQDLDTASRLSQNQEVALPAAVNPLDFLPDEQAALASRPLIAAPAESAASVSGQTAASINASQGQFVLPAGQTELEIVNQAVVDTSYIYLIPAQKTNNLISVKNKSVGRFTAAATQAVEKDQIIDYYIIND